MWFAQELERLSRESGGGRSGGSGALDEFHCDRASVLPCCMLRRVLSLHPCASCMLRPFRVASIPLSLFLRERGGIARRLLTRENTRTRTHCAALHKSAVPQ